MARALIASWLLVAMPGAPNSVLIPSADSVHSVCLQPFGAKELEQDSSRVVMSACPSPRIFLFCGEGAQSAETDIATQRRNMICHVRIYCSEDFGFHSETNALFVF